MIDLTTVRSYYEAQVRILGVSHVFDNYLDRLPKESETYTQRRYDVIWFIAQVWGVGIGGVSISRRSDLIVKGKAVRFSYHISGKRGDFPMPECCIQYLDGEYQQEDPDMRFEREQSLEEELTNILNIESVEI